MTQAMDCWAATVCVGNSISLFLRAQGNATAVKAVKCGSTEFVGIWKS